MRTCHNTNITVKTPGGYASTINRKSETPNNILSNTTRDLPLNSIQKKEHWCLAYQYVIYISLQTNNRFHGNVNYLLWNGSIPEYKNMKIWGLRVYITKGNVTRKKLDDISQKYYFMAYVATKGFIIYWKPYHTFSINREHHVWFDEYNYGLYIEDRHTPGSLRISQSPEIILHIQDMINFISCELDITSTPFFHIKSLTYKIELTTSEKNRF